MVDQFLLPLAAASAPQAPCRSIHRRSFGELFPNGKQPGEKRIAASAAEQMLHNENFERSLDGLIACASTRFWRAFHADAAARIERNSECQCSSGSVLQRFAVF